MRSRESLAALVERVRISVSPVQFPAVRSVSACVFARSFRFIFDKVIWDCTTATSHHELIGKRHFNFIFNNEFQRTHFRQGSACKCMTFYRGHKGYCCAAAGQLPAAPHFESSLSYIFRAESSGRCCEIVRVFGDFSLFS